MTVTPVDGPFRADVSAVSPAGGPATSGSFERAVASVLGSTGRKLEAADGAEAAFAAGTGSLQAMVLERAQADVALSLTVAAALRVTQSLTTILGMQI